MELVDTVLVSQASLLTQLMAIAPELVAVLMKLQCVMLESHAACVLAVHPQCLRQLVFVHRCGVVMRKVGLVGAVSQWQSLLTPVLRELGVSIEKTLQNLKVALYFGSYLSQFFVCAANQDLVQSGGDLDPLGIGRQLKV